jgi:hypothetical protein
MKKVINLFKGYSKVTIAIVAIISLIIFNLGFVLTSHEADAAQLTKVKDTITDSDTAVVSNHTIQFKTQSAVSASTTVTIDFPDSFKTTTTPAFANTDALDFDIATTSVELGERELEVFAFGQCPGSDTGYATSSFEITSISSANLFTFTHCNGTPDLPAAATTTIEIGTHASYLGAGTSRIENADDTGSYVITVNANSGTDTGDTRVYIISDVALTAAVETTFTFSISGVNQGVEQCDTGVGGVDETSTGITLPFGTLETLTAKTLAQDLQVTTNAANGFVVTIQQDQNPTSGSADIDVFDDGVAQTSPTGWSPPQGSLAGGENTWGHYGYTSEDDLNSDEFGDGTNYAGFDGTNPDEIFSNDGPADNTTPDVGRTQVCYKMEVSALQEAANDYTNNITYIATPTF